jgi:dihydroorotase
MYCLPILKRETHRQALLKAATSGMPFFFIGTDRLTDAYSASPDLTSS